MTRFCSGLVRWWFFAGWNARGTIVCPREEEKRKRRKEKGERSYWGLMVCGGSGKVFKLGCGWLCPRNSEKDSGALLGVVVDCSVCGSKKYLPVMGNGQWATNYLVQDTVLFLHLLLLAFGDLKHIDAFSSFFFLE